MKRILLLVTLGALISTMASAVPFEPSTLRLSASQYIQYDFDGTSLSIPVTVSGSNAGVIFLVYTQGKGAQIGTVRNGYLGWHYVNKIDTCLYAAPMQSLTPGQNAIVWNGKDTYGSKVPSDNYTYYMWAYDNIGQGVKISDSPDIDFRETNNMGHIKETGDDGMPLANPIFYTGLRTTDQGKTIFKWVLGNDPVDPTLVESTYFTIAEGWTFTGGVMTFHPNDHNNFFWEYGNKDTYTKCVEKRGWVPNGQSLVDLEWGEEGRFTFDASDNCMPGVQTDGSNYLFTGVGYRHVTNEAKSDFYIVDLNDGSRVQYYDMSAWWCSAQDLNAGGQMNGGPDTGFVYRSGNLFLSGGDSCMKQMVDPAAETEEDFYKWTNGNGDYTFDWNADPGAARPWVCIDYKVGPYVFNWTVDANRFSMGSAYDMGAVTWGLLAPDGTGLGYISTAGETAAWKWGALIVDNGSAFDGIYKDPSDNVRTAGVHPLLFLGHDSIKGTIGNDVSVKDASPTAFTVAQNSPNPFNPTTTITFTLAKAGKTTVEVYNVAGQKISTLVDGSMSAGSHSVVWNASNVSAGVYFYTVRSGSFTKTMKMTLLK